MKEYKSCKNSAKGKDGSVRINPIKSYKLPRVTKTLILLRKYEDLLGIHKAHSLGISNLWEGILHQCHSRKLTSVGEFQIKFQQKQRESKYLNNASRLSIIVQSRPGWGKSHNQLDKFISTFNWEIWTQLEKVESEMP